jgi:hypothetical protein
MKLSLDIKSVLVGVGIVSIFAFSNNVNIADDTIEAETKRTIDVIGSSEMDIIPDEVEIKFTYTEWVDKSGKKAQSARMSVIEPVVIKSIVEAGIAKKDIKMASVYGSQGYYYYRRHQRDDHVVSKTLSVCISDVEAINKILLRFEKNGLDERAISRIAIGEKDHEKMTEFRQKVKEDAIIAAKKKAAYLLGAIEQEPGMAISVKEVNGDNQNSWNRNTYANFISNERSSSGGSNDGLAFSPVNLRYEIAVTFEII